MATTSLLDFSTPHVLRNAKEYRAAVSEIDRLLDADPRRGTPDSERLEFLSVLVEAYEDEHDPLDEAGGSPQSVVAFMLEQRGLTRADLHDAMEDGHATSDDVATVIVALRGPSAPTYEPIRACTEYVHAPTGTLFSTQLVVVTTSQPVSTTWATFEVS